MADADHERAGRARRRACPTACASTATTCGGRRAVPRRVAASPCCAAARTARSTRCCRPTTAPAPRCTSTAVARGGCATACCGSPTGRRSGSTGSSRAARRCRSRRSPRCRAACATPTATCTPTAPRSSASRRSTTPTAARPPTRSCGSPPTSRARPRCVVEGPDFVSDPRWRPDGDGVLLARVGPPRHAVGRHPARGRRRRATRTVVAGGDERESIGQPTWAPDGVALVLRRPHRVLEPLPLDAGRRARRPSSTSAPTSASRSGCSASRRYAFLGDGRVVFAYSRRRARAARGVGARRRPGRARSTCPHTIDRRAAGARRPRGVHRRRRHHRAARRRGRRRRRRGRRARAAARPRPRRRAGSRSPSRSRSRPPAARTAHALLYPPTNPDVRRARRASGRRCS